MFNKGEKEKMSEYIKPVVLGNDDLAEGVYAASGSTESTDCWTVDGRSVQSWNGSHNVFEMSAQHSSGVAHITTQVVFTYTFSAPLTDASSEFDSSFSGNTVVVTRNLHANGYYSGDDVTFKVWVSAGDQAATEALTLTGISYVCRHETNVQGGID